MSNKFFFFLFVSFSDPMMDKKKPTKSYARKKGLFVISHLIFLEQVFNVQKASLTLKKSKLDCFDEQLEVISSQVIIFKIKMCSFPVDFDVGKLTEKLFHNHFATASSYPLSSNRSRAFVSSLLDEHRVKCDRCNQSLNELGMKSNQKTFVTGETSTFLNLQLTFF